MKKKWITMRVLIILSGVVFCLGSSAFAQQTEDYSALVSQYVRAVKSQDRLAIGKAVRLLRENNRARIYMRQNAPKAYRSYLYQSSYERLVSVKRKFRGELDPFIASSVGKTSTKGDSSNNQIESSSRSNYTNRDTTRNNATQDHLRNQSKVSVSETVRRSPNNERTPNSTRSVRRNR